MKEVKESLQIAPMRFKPIPESLVDEIVTEYPKKRAQYLKDRRTKWAKQSFSPYNVGKDCNAYHFFSIRDWDSVPEPDPDLLEIFHEGVLHEPDVVEKVKSAGYKISAINVPFTLTWGTALSLRGKIDFYVEHEGIVIPCEAKSMSPYAFHAVNTWEDFLKSKSVYHRCYPYQLMTYQHVSAQAGFGLFVLKDKVSGQVKFVKQPYDGTMVRDIQKRAIIVSKALKAKKLDLEPLKNKDPVLCGKCEFKFQCLGDDAEKMVEMLEDAELEELLLRREQLAPLSSEYDRIDKLVKKSLKNKPEVLIGDFLITGKEVERKAYAVDAGSYWKTDIIYRGSKIITDTQTSED